MSFDSRKWVKNDSEVKMDGLLERISSKNFLPEKEAK